MTDQLAADGLDGVGAAPDASTSDAATVDGTSVGRAVEADPASPSGVRLARNRFRRSGRVSRWDRPPEPRDWRFVVGTIGKILITTGLLLFGFVAYQLWGTGIETARAQHQLENQFAELVTTASSSEFSDREMLVAEVPVEARIEVPADGSTDTAVEPEADSATGTDPAVDEPQSAPAAPVAVDLADEAVVQENLPRPFRGEPLLRLEIPKIGRDDIVVPGVSVNDLKNGPGHYPDTPLPGQLGNAAIAGHRTTYGAPFFDVDRLAPGDEIITTLLNGDRFVYEVTFLEIVSASDYQVVATTNPNIAELTLTSCHPKYTARDRIIVHSVLNPEKSSNVGFPTFYMLEPAPDDEAIPGDDPTLSTDPATGEPAEIEVTATDSARVEIDAPATADDEPADAAAPSAGDDDPPATDTADAADDRDEATAAADDRDPVDAFSQGWFADRAAFAQIALWALVLALVSIAAYRISRRYRNLAVGVALGAVPFLVALYFFYQNVNRLLPPGI